MSTSNACWLEMTGDMTRSVCERDVASVTVCVGRPPGERHAVTQVSAAGWGMVRADPGANCDPRSSALGGCAL